MVIWRVQFNWLPRPSNELIIWCQKQGGTRLSFWGRLSNAVLRMWRITILPQTYWRASEKVQRRCNQISHFKTHHFKNHQLKPSRTARESVSQRTFLWHFNCAGHLLMYNLHKRFALCKPPAGAPFFCFIFLGAQKNEVAARRRHGAATRRTKIKKVELLPTLSTSNAYPLNPHERRKI